MEDGLLQYCNKQKKTVTHITRLPRLFYIQKIENKCLVKKGNIITINLKKFLVENNEIRLKIFSNCIKKVSKNYYPPRAKKVLNLLDRIESSQKIKATLGGCLINKEEKKLTISKEN